MSYKENNTLDNRINFSEIENNCKKYWEESNVYRYDNTRTREETFIVDTPPPTVSGSLHIGHIFSYTQTDVIARYQRMSGKTVLYPIGWDDNGLPTERRVQNYYNISCNPLVSYDENFKPEHVENDKSPRKEISRKNFIDACELLTEADEGVFENVFKNIGHSYDWNIKYSTISPDSIRVAQESFIDLYNKGYVSSVESPTMWDVTFQSAVAQAEIEDKEVAGFFHDIKFKIEGTDDNVIIATTRPEFLPACIAIVAHPDDERYKAYFGKKAIVPLFETPVEIVPSEHAEKDKGTGIMMVCTFGDAADVAWWKTSGLPLKQIIGQNGCLLDVEFGKGAFVSNNPEAANQYYGQLVGLTTKKARERIVELLKENNYLNCDPRPITHMVKFYEKGNLPIEFVTSRQWFVKLLDKKEEMLEAGRQIKWKPHYMQHRYEEWVKGLNQDWCISRQRFFGVPFPVWYKIDEKGNVDYNSPIVAELSQLPVDPMVDVPNGYDESSRGKPNGFVGDKDVMDTWATSALTPQIALDVVKNDALKIPFDIRPQAHDIIRTWAFYTIAKAVMHSKTIPWKEILISGFILDPDRKKMSKSKGNVVTPQHLIDNYGADSVRYWAARARLGIDTAFEEQIMAQGKKLVNKIFNASKFVFSMVENSKLKGVESYESYITNPMDISWLSKLDATIKQATENLNLYDYAAALELIEKRFWDFCDYYLEIVKKRAYSETDTSAVASLMKTIDIFLKLFAPFCPFITEEIYQCRPWGECNTSLHGTLWPSRIDMQNVNEDTGTLYDLTSVIAAEIRKAKTSANTSQRTAVSKIEIGASLSQQKVLEQGLEDIINVGNLSVSAIEFKETAELSIGEIVLDLQSVA